MKPFKIFIGYDPCETVAYHVLSHSLLSRASIPITITPLVRSALSKVGAYRRPRTAMESTDFSLTRFLVPWLSGYEGVSLFMDCDMLCRTDIADLLDFCTGHESVLVCQHDYIPKTATKFLDQPQTRYPRKNWSSLMLFNNARCQQLTPAYVNSVPPLELHRFVWTQSVGALPLEWNWLVGEYAPNPDAKILHYTIGGPWFRDYQFCDQADLWFQEMDLVFPALNMPKPVEV